MVDKWFIAIGDNMAWGRATSSDEAVRNMNKNSGKRAKRYAVYQVSEATRVNDMGGFTRPKDDPAPIVVKPL